MMRSSLQMLYLSFASAVISSVISHDCAFIPGPVSASNDTLIITVYCHNDGEDEGLANTTGDNTGLAVYLVNCPIPPVGLFVNVSAKLSTVSVLSEHSERLHDGTFEGLANIAELRLEGFQTLRFLGDTVFRPLRSLQRLVLIGFGAHRLRYAELGAALYHLSGTPLSRIVMHRIHSARNEKTLDVSALFRMRDVSVRELSFSHSVVTGISGRLSQTLPHLNYLCVGANARFFAAANALLDVWLNMDQLNEMVLYAYPIPDAANAFPNDVDAVPSIDSLDFFVGAALVPYLFKKNCYSGLEVPLRRSMRRLTIRNLQMLKLQIDKPICFHNENHIEYLDIAGFILPTNSTRLAGLDRLKYLDMQNTGIVELPGDFLSYFPKLEAINLVKLSIGESMQRINSSFFGNCPTLREIHLGDCHLTNIPPTAFVHVPLVQTLNLSSNSLRTFDVSLSNSSNLSRLNLSDNAISTLSEDVLVELNTVAQRRLDAGGILTVDLRRNPLSCLCNSTHFVRQLQDWVAKQRVNVHGFEEYTCQYPNGSVLVMSEVDVDQSETECSVLSEVKNGSDCPCDDDLRRRLQLVKLSLHGVFCRRADGGLISMTVQPLPSCPDFFRSATFIVPVVSVAVLMMAIAVISIVLYRNRRINQRLRGFIERLSIPSRIVRLGISHLMKERKHEDPNSFLYDVFLYIQDNDQDAVQHLFDDELSSHRRIRRHDDFSVGLKLETLLENVRTCRWLVPVLSPNFVDDGECCHFIVRAQYNRPHAIVPVVWKPFHPGDLTIASLLDTAEPVTWPGDEASEADKAAFWITVLHRTRPNREPETSL